MKSIANKDESILLNGKKNTKYKLISSLEIV